MQALGGTIAKKSQVMSTPGILITRSLIKSDETRTIPIRLVNTFDQTVTLQKNTHIGKIFPVAWGSQNNAPKTQCFRHLKITRGT